MSAFADTGELDGKPASVVASCFLIRHRRWRTPARPHPERNSGLPD